MKDDVVGRRLFPLAIGIFASREYLDKNLPNAGPSGEGLNWIGWGDFFPVPKLIEQSPYPMAEVRHVVRDTVMHMNLLRNGCGMSPMLAFCTDVYPELEQVPGTELFLDRSIWLLLHSDLRSTSRVRRFVDFVADALKEIRSSLQGEKVDPPRNV